MKSQDYLLQQLNKLKTLLSPKVEKMQKDGYSIIYDSYWESDVNEEGESIQDGFIEITIQLEGQENSLDYCYCICENVGGRHEEMHEIEQYYEDLLLDIQSLENMGTRGFKKLYKKQIINIRKALYPNTPFSWIIDWGIWKTFFLTCIVFSLGCIFYFVLKNIFS